MMNVNTTTMGQSSLLSPCQRPVLSGTFIFLSSLGQRRWISHRKLIFPDSPFLFITSKGGPISCNHDTGMLHNLSRAAGYREGFFTAQSFRRSYANCIAAEIYSKGGTVADVVRKIADGCRWYLRSKIAEKY